MRLDQLPLTWIVYTNNTVAGVFEYYHCSRARAKRIRKAQAQWPGFCGMSKLKRRQPDSVSLWFFPFDQKLPHYLEINP